MTLRVLLDANVLYPAALRSLFIDLGVLGVIEIHWTDQIQDEWTRNLLAHRSDLDETKLRRTRDLMNRALDGANITGHEPLIQHLELPDPDDRHVLAAAINGQVEVVVTQNLRDFPATILAKYSIRAIHPDELLCTLLQTHTSQLAQALEAQQARYRNPPVTATELRNMLRQQGVPLFAQALTELNH